MGANPNDYNAMSGRTGAISPVADGSFQPLRVGKSAALIVQEASGRYFEAGSRKKLFIAMTAVAGVAPGTALSTAPAFSLYNPVNSGILVAIHKVFVGYLSGTLGPGFMAHAQNASQVAAPTGGTAIVPICSYLDGSTRSVATCYTGSTISATSTLVRPSINLNAIAGVGDAAPSVAVDELGGEIVVPAGVAYCFQGIAGAGTSPKVVLGVLFEEIIIP